MSSSKSTKHHSFIQTISSLTTFVFLMVFLPSHGASNTRQYNIGVLMMDEDKSRTGKEAKVAMEIAAKNLNDKSMNHKLRLHFNYTGGNPMQAAYAAEQLIREEEVQALIVMETWDETASVAVVGSLAKVPIISFASKSASLPRPLKPSLQLQWPYLIQMGSDITKQINIAAAIIQTFKWQKIVAIYELDQYGGDSSGAFVALNDALEEKDVEIEYGLALPPFSSLDFDPQTFIRRELEELTKKSSRVFVVLRSSMSMAAHLFTEANNMGLIGQDSVWIVLEDIASQLHSFNTSVILSMQGALGIKQYYSEESLEFLNFNHKFRKRLQSQYPNENNFDIGIYALRAYDSVAAIARAIENSSARNSSIVLKEILAQHFLRQFHSGSLSLNSSVYSLVNVAPTSPINLGFWTPEFGFSEKLPIFENASESMQVLASLVKYWPGGLGRVPKGWSMPRAGKIMKIGVPGRTTFEKFVKVGLNKSSNTTIYTGFCIELFQEAVKILKESYPFPYEFEAYYGSYDDLVNHVANKSYDAVIGDVTILASRSKYVEFTQPYAESGLAMVVLNKPDHSWIFLKPFTREMWALTAAILIYTVVIVWLLERGESNPEFQGPWYDQLSVALWFTFSSLFFVQREQVRSNYTRVVVIVWFFVVLALTISYTAILTSLLTVIRLKPNVTDINWLRTHNATIGCDGDSFIRKYLVDVLEFESTNIRNISSEYNYPREFESGNIMAAFLELPCEKTFINQYCKRYTVPETTKYKGDRFGGLGFVFQKGSPIATDVSEAILNMSENGVLKQLHEKWFSPSPVCRTSQKNVDYNMDSLDWQGFWGLYLFSAATSTISYLIFAAHQYYKRHQREAHNSNRMLDSLDYNIVAWNKYVTLISLFNRVREKVAPETSLVVEPKASDETKEQIQVSLTEIGTSDSVLG